ncbi:hypothetical protein [Deinococcus sp. PESE-13]
MTQTVSSPASVPAVVQAAALAQRTPPVPVISLLVSLIACLMLTVFAWPAIHTAPNHLPVALVAPAPVAAQLERRLEQARPGAFDLKEKRSAAAARNAIRNREVYGAIVMTQTGPQVLTASAASPAVAQLLAQVPAMMNPAPSNVTDIKSATASDPRQAGMAAIGLPLVLGGMMSAVMLTRFYRSARARILGLTLTALFAGFGSAAILQLWLGTLSGNYLLNSLTVALGIAALGSFILGLESLLGLAGLGLGAVLMMFLANPFSALSSAPELLPGSWGQFGQLLPPGAFGTLIRSEAFFGGAGSARPLTVLLVWLAAGLLLTWLGSQRKRRIPLAAQVA